MKLYLSLLAVLLVPVELAAGPGARALLTPELGLAVDSRALRQGRVLVRILDAPDGAEVAAIAAVHVAATAAGFRDCARVPSCLLGHDELRGAARVTSASVDSDLAQLQLDAHDRQHLERCRVGKCGVRLPAAAIERFRKEVDWSDPNAALQASALFRQMLGELVRGYAATGDSGLVAYEDDGRYVSVAQSFAALLARPLPPLSLAPDLRLHLRSFPVSPLAAGEDYLCWRQERFWMQNLVTLEHVALEPTSDGDVVVAVKQLYASHYFDAAVSVLAFDPDDAGGGLLVQMTRARADVRPPGFAWYERVLLNRLVRGRLQRQLDALRARLETPRVAEARAER